MFSTVGVFYKTNDILMRKMVLSSLVLCHNFAASSVSETITEQHSKWHEPMGFDTNIAIYNPLIKRKSKLILQNKNLVKWYTCGPTVYDSAHIGHASSYVKLDIVRRILTDVFNLNVIYLMGITDIDDKIINRSNEAKEDFRSLAQRYEIEFFNDLEKLNVRPPTMTVKVSDHVQDIVSFVDTIVKKGYGYKGASGSVYFDAQGLKSYGKLFPPSSIENMEPAPDKKSPLDFTLWKAAKPQEPHWPSPWGPGRPGWHIECSAMASKVLGPQLDIHSGGQDLVFPHHENEEAQSCAHHNTSQWVNYWMHTGTLEVKGDVKMSKSLKNTISISQLLDTYSSNHFRMLCLLSPYRNRIYYCPETMSTATGNCRRIESFVDDCNLYLTGVKASVAIDEAAVFNSIDETKAAVLAHLADDFDTCRAVDELLRFIGSVNIMLAKPAQMESAPCSLAAVASALQFVKQTLTTFGYTFPLDRAGKVDTKRLSAVLDAAVDLRSTVREVARQPDMAKPQRIRLLQACDSLRDSFTQVGVELKDHGQKSTWNLKDAVVPPKSE